MPLYRDTFNFSLKPIGLTLNISLFLNMRNVSVMRVALRVKIPFKYCCNQMKCRHSLMFCIYLLVNTRLWINVKSFTRRMKYKISQIKRALF